jgi:hypothetical protein
LPKSKHRYLVYLTRAFPKLEIVESVRLSVDAGIKDAEDRIFGLEWQDVLESAAANAQRDVLLNEVLRFLKIRGFEAFRGFRAPPTKLKQISGTFYGTDYFAAVTEGLDPSKLSEGRFYGN